MYSASELHKLGKAISHSYLEGDTDLTEGLQKAASMHNLNEQQIKRVAETANVETYVSLLKTADDKYIEFNLADAQKVQPKQSSTEKTSYINDYESSPEYKFDAQKLFPGLDLSESTEKTASVEENTVKYAQQMRGTIDFLINALSDEVMNYQSNLSKVAYMTKQAYLQDSAMSQYYTAIDMACPRYSDQV